MTHPTVPTLEPVFDVVVDLGAPEQHGSTRAGARRVVPIVGGRIRGEIDADVLAGGADWQLLRDDGAIEIDCRYSARTTEGELLLLHVAGVRSGAPDVLASLLHGVDVDPADYYFRTAVRIETSAPRLAHLQDAVHVASCLREATQVRFVTYRVT